MLLASDQVHRDAFSLGTQMANQELENKLRDLTGDLRNLANKEAGEARSRSAAVAGKCVLFFFALSLNTH